MSSYLEKLKRGELASKFSDNVVHLFAWLSPRCPKVEYNNSVLFGNKGRKLSVAGDINKVAHGRLCQKVKEKPSNGSFGDRMDKKSEMPIPMTIVSHFIILQAHY